MGALPQLFNNTSLFCADHTINVGTGTCHGDSGGPSFKRVFSGGSEMYILAGVVSGSGNTFQCGGKLPDFYTFLAQEKVLLMVMKQKKTAKCFSLKTLQLWIVTKLA